MNREISQPRPDKKKEAWKRSSAEVRSQGSGFRVQRMASQERAVLAQGDALAPKSSCSSARELTF
eukprot:776120-Rhodomonas_salina.1